MLLETIYARKSLTRTPTQSLTGTGSPVRGHPDVRHTYFVTGGRKTIWLIIAMTMRKEKAMMAWMKSHCMGVTRLYVWLIVSPSYT